MLVLWLHFTTSCHFWWQSSSFWQFQFWALVLWLHFTVAILAIFFHLAIPISGVVSLKEQCHEIFDLWFFSPINPT
jgi:hypothetical protein